MGTDKPVITVLTLSYNSPSLEAAVDSVLAQDYDNIQLIIIDDHSERFDENSLRGYITAKNRGNITELVIVRNQQNLGITASSNEALRRASGKYIVNLAGDDAFYDGRVISDLYHEFEKTGAMIITGYREVYDSNLEKPQKIQPEPEYAELVRSLSPGELFSAMEGFNFVFGCCTARSAECVRKYGLYDEQYCFLDDYSMNMKLLRSGVKFHFMDRVLIKYRGGGVSSLSKIDDRYFEESDMLFHNEIEPYSSSPQKAREKYRRWKTDTRDRKNYEYKLNSCGCMLKPLIMAQYAVIRLFRHIARLFVR